MTRTAQRVSSGPGWCVLIGMALVVGALLDIFNLGWQGWLVSFIAFLSGRAVQALMPSD